MRNNGVYKSDISTARWIAYDLPGNVGWILYFAGLILSFANFPEYSRDIFILSYAGRTLLRHKGRYESIAFILKYRRHMAGNIKDLRGVGDKTARILEKLEGLC